MQLKTILNKCHKFKHFIYTSVRIEIIDDREVIEVEIRPRKGSRLICSACNKEAPGYDKLDWRRFEFIPIWGFAVFFLYQMRRVNCACCGVKVEKVPWANGKHELTTTYMCYLAAWAKMLSWQEVANHFQTSWEKIFSAVEFVVTWGLAHRDLSGITAIGVDEIARHKGHDYLTVAYQIDPDNSRLLWVGEERKASTLEVFFQLLGPERCALIEYVCSDMWPAYLKVIAQYVGQAMHVLDRFHLVSKLNKAIDEVRAEEHREMKKAGYEPVLKKSRWCLLKRRENLTEAQDMKLNELLKYNLKSVRAYLLKEDFESFWEYISPAWAEKFLDKWCARVMRSRIEPMKKVVGTIRSHKTLILNWFKAKKVISNGIVEGFNNKAKVTARKSYGFRTFRCHEIALYHALGKLPEPPTTHRFY